MAKERTPDFLHPRGSCSGVRENPDLERDYRYTNPEIHKLARERNGIGAREQNGTGARERNWMKKLGATLDLRELLLGSGSAQQVRDSEQRTFYLSKYCFKVNFSDLDF